MKSSDVIKRISKFAGINETEEQLFFDAFTKKLFEKFKAGDLLKIDDVGFIHLKNIKTSENNHQFKGIVFSENKRASTDDSYFFLSNDRDIFHPGDFCFSPSIKKMEIPLGGDIETEIFVPPMGDELLSFIDVKIENLLNETEMVDNLNESETFTIQIEKEIPETDIVENLEDNSSFKPVEEDKEKVVQPEKFKKIDSISSSLNEDASNKFKDETSIHKKPIIVVKDEKDKTEITDEKGFTRVKFNKIESLSEQGKKKAEKPEDEKVEEKKEEKQPISGAEKSKIIQSLKEDEVQKHFREKRKITEKKKTIPEPRIKRRLKGKSLIPIIIIAVLAVAIYFYRFYDFGNLNNSAGMNTLPVSHPVEIKRNYDISVDYPYLAKNRESLIFDGIGSAVFLPHLNKVESTQQELTKESKIPTVKEGAYRNLGDYVFTDGKIYFVQLSSWKYMSNAVKEMERLKKEGYKVSVEKVISSSGDILYRVKLGDFKSLAEARKYVQNY